MTYIKHKHICVCLSVCACCVTSLHYSHRQTDRPRWKKSDSCNENSIISIIPHGLRPPLVYSNFSGLKIINSLYPRNMLEVILVN